MANPSPRKEDVAATATARPWEIIQDWPRLISKDVPGLSDAGESISIAETKFHSLISTEEAAANAALIVRAVNSHDALVKALEDSDAALGRVTVWLERLAVHADSKAVDERFITLRKAYVADAKNYRATAANIKPAFEAARAALAKSGGAT